MQKVSFAMKQMLSIGEWKCLTMYVHSMTQYECDKNVTFLI